MPDTIIIGIDGANWDLLDPWVREDHLPNIKKLRSTGEYSDLRSELPPVTCPNWRCYSTGKNPGKLGVYWWESIDTERHTLSTPTSRSFKSANYWDYLNVEGKSAGIVNLPMTYPPFDIDGYMISGGPGSEQVDYTSPPTLGPKLDSRDYRLHPDTVVTSSDDRKAAADIVDLIDHRFSEFANLLQNHDVSVAHLTIFYINTLQHFFWRGDPTFEAWKLIDKHIGDIRNDHPDSTLILMSDHGCVEIDTVFYANSWLEERGYLTTDPGLGSALGKLGITERRLASIAQKMGIRTVLNRLVPEVLKNQIPTDEGAQREQKLQRVNWDESRAIASGQGLVYVFDDSNDTKHSLIGELRELTSGLTNTPIAREIHSSEEIYNGPYVDEAPDIIFDQTPGVHTSDGLGNNPIFDETTHWRAENTRTGLFLIDGPNVTGTLDQTISITDIAPTILHSVNCSIPTDMDGKPLRLFEHGDPPTTSPLSPDFIDTESRNDIEDRLSGLGYLE